MKLHLNRVMMTDVCVVCVHWAGNQHKEYGQKRLAICVRLCCDSYEIFDGACVFICLYVYVCDLNLNMHRRLIRHSTYNFNGINHTTDRPWPKFLIFNAYFMCALIGARWVHIRSSFVVLKFSIASILLNMFGAFTVSPKKGPATKYTASTSLRRVYVAVLNFRRC